MAIIYEITIDPTGKEAGKESRFRITLHNVETNREDFFEQSAREIMQDQTWRAWQNPSYQLDIGLKLFRFLDGDSRHLQRALDEASQQGELLHLILHTCNQVANWPFELLAQKDTFLVPHRLHLVRRVSDWGAARDLPPKNRQLKLLFMACSALDVEPELNFEREEEAIFLITEKLAIDMEVEDSGSLEGLREQLEREQYDVVHLSGHADIDKNGRPYFIMEDETGCAQQVFSDGLWNEGLIENPPRLLFLSGCRTGEALDRGAAVSFARMLVKKYDIPAVLGWERSVADDQAIHAEKILYHELSRGKTLLDAVQRARYELTEKFQSSTNLAWPLLRLFSNGMSLDAFVTKGQRQRPKSRQMVHVYLKQSQVQVLAEGFVGRRRQMQASLRALEQDYYKVGVLLLGTGGLGKSCLAGKICERFSHHTLIIVHGKLDTITLEAALKDAFILAQDEKGRQILSQQMEMTDKLARLCVTSFKEKNYLLLQDEIDHKLEGLNKGAPGPLLLEALDLLKVLLHWLPSSGQMTQLIITSRYEFSLTEQAQDLVKERVEKVWLTSFQETERLKKAQELKNILNYADQPIMQRLLAGGFGNPLLMERVDELVGRMTADDVPGLLGAIASEQEEFIHQHVSRKLLQCGGDELARFLRRFSIYRRPVLLEGVEQISKIAGLEKIEGLLKRGMGLSLIEHDQTRRTYQLTPLLREELLKDLEEYKACHRAALVYYKKVCKARKMFDPILVEEWIFHALGCEQEETASRQGGRLVTYLGKRQELQEAKRVGMWILEEKKRRKRELTTADDSYLLNELACIMRSLDCYVEAIKYFEQALSIDEKLFGKGHQKLTIRLNNLGAVWDDLGKKRKAISYYEQALRIDEAAYGRVHPDVAADLNNLGAAWKDLRETRKAIEYYEEVLSIWKEVYGETHENAAVALNNLGAAWKDLGELQKAIRYFEQALHIDIINFGKRHQKVAYRFNNLAIAYRELGKTDRAIEYFEQAYEIFCNLFGSDHPDSKLTFEWLEDIR